jgi:hypothetical protein
VVEIQEVDEAEEARVRTAEAVEEEDPRADKEGV